MQEVEARLLGKMSTVNETHIEGLTTIASNFCPKETMDRLETEIRTKGMEVFARIDHAAGAADVGLNVRPTELIIFGNARGGTLLMQSMQTIVNKLADLLRAISTTAAGLQ